MTPATAYPLSDLGKVMKLTEQDWRVLMLLSTYQISSIPAYRMAGLARFRTRYPNETAARRLIKLTKLGLAEKTGTRMYPEWRITPAGILALKEKDKTDG